MATHSDLPELHTNQYSVERVGEEVMWPLVDGQWGDDWREEAVIDPDGMRMPRRGVMPAHIEERGQLLTTDNVDAILRASCIAEPVIDETDIEKALEFSRRVPLASLMVVLHVDSDAKDQMINRAIQDEEAREDEYGDEDEDEDEDEEAVLESSDDEYEGVVCRGVNDFDDPGILSALITTEFQFDDTNLAYVHRSQKLQAPDGEIIWMPRVHIDKENPEASRLIHMPGTFNQAELDLLECGLQVFRAPQAILRALEQIRQQPID